MAPERRKTRSRLWFELHSWLGLKLSIFMSFVLITGTLAVFSSEMDWATHASMRVAPRPAAERASWGALYAAVRAAYPDWSISVIAEPIDAWFTAQANARTPDGGRRLIDIDPYTAQVTGDRAWLSFHRFFRNTHRHLMLPVRYGVPIVSALSLVLLGSLATGLVVYKKFWRGFLRPPRTRDARTFNGDLHRLLGLWTLWFTPLIGLTGLFYLAESLGWRAPPFGSVADLPAREAALTGEDIDAMAAATQATLPGLRIAQLVLPAEPGDPLVFQGYTDGTWLVRPRASYVAFDPHTHRVVGSHRSRDATLHQRISEMADPLHFGYFGGLGTKLVWFVCGAALSALSVTGVVIYGTRLAKAARRGGAAGVPAAHPERPRTQGRGGALRPGLEHLWDGMGAWKWLGIAAMLTTALLTPLAARGQPPDRPAAPHSPHRDCCVAAPASPAAEPRAAARTSLLRLGRHSA